VVEIAYHSVMRDADDLPDPCWTPDPADRVALVMVHADDCPARDGAGCGCRPRLELRLVTRPRDPDADDRVVEFDLVDRRAV